MLLRENFSNDYLSLLNRLCKLRITRCYHTVVLMCDSLKIFLNCLYLGKGVGYVQFTLG